MKRRQFIVKSHRPWHRLLIVAAWLGLGGLVVAAYELGHYQGGYKRLQFSEQRERLETALADQTRDNRDLREQNTRLERTQAIDSESYQVVRQELKQLQEEILELREEVEFYRGIVSPTERQAGLNIQTFQFDRAGGEGLYHFELVMSQVLKNDRYVEGQVKIHLQGVQDGEPLSLDFRDISPNDSVGQKFRFRYFQRMEGDIRLPAGFTARNVIVEMLPRGRKSISKSFPWSLGNN